LAYGYVLHKDYSLAEQAFRDFSKHPNERLVPDAQYWLGESLFSKALPRRGVVPAVSTKFERAKAPGHSCVLANRSPR
jgi:hypothetical protein